MIIELEIDGHRRQVLTDTAKIWLSNGRQLELSNDSPSGETMGILVSNGIESPSLAVPLVIYPLAANMVSIHLGKDVPSPVDPAHQ